MIRPSDTSLTRVLGFGGDPALRRRFMIIDEPLLGNLRFGLLLEALDKLAEDAALAYVRRFQPEARVVTAAIDNIYIRHAADVTRDMVLRARLNYVGSSSMEVGIRVEHLAEGGATDHIASCYFTMVAREGSGEGARSLKLPPLEYLDEEEKRRVARATANREAHRRASQAAQEPPSREEYALLTQLHAAQEQPGFAGLLARDQCVSTWDRTYPEHENVPQKIFGGYIGRRAYECASLCAEQVAPDRPVIVAVNRINFHQPVRMGDKLHFRSCAVYAGEHSVAVETSIVRISRDRKQSALSNTCVFTFVNVDAKLRPRPVPTIYPTTYAEDDRFLQAYRRRVSHLGWRATRRK